MSEGTATGTTLKAGMTGVCGLNDTDMFIMSTTTSSTQQESQRDIPYPTDKKREQFQERRPRRSSLKPSDCSLIGEAVEKKVEQYMRRSSFSSAGSFRSLVSNVTDDDDEEEEEEEKTIETEASAARYDNVQSHVPTFRMEDIVVGRLLGSGSFNDAYEAHMPSVSPTTRNSITCTVSSLNPEKKYVVKHLKNVVMDSYDEFLVGAKDLAIEAKMLSFLDHPNIVKLEGVTAGCPSEAISSGIVGGYFLILERLDATLADKLTIWRSSKLSRRPSLANLRRASMGTASKSFHSRLSVASQIADAIAYLHKNKIMFRDLKPKNCGINDNGQVKLFDFGLAKEITAAATLDDDEDDDRKHTGMVGSIRYMSPEVARSLPYGLEVDVYSFSLLLHEVLSLEKPFSKLSNKTEFIYKVHYDVDSANRPEIPSNIPESMAHMIREGWSFDATKRPSMASYARALNRWLKEDANTANTATSKAVKDRPGILKSRSTTDVIKDAACDSKKFTKKMMLRRSTSAHFSSRRASN